MHSTPKQRAQSPRFQASYIFPSRLQYPFELFMEDIQTNLEYPFQNDIFYPLPTASRFCSVIIMYSAEQYKTNYSGIREEYDTIIKHTREMIKYMTMQQRFQKANSHIMDALLNKPPRPVYRSQQLNTGYYVLEYIQSSVLWDWLIFFLSYAYMYLVILDEQSYATKIALEGTVLLIFIFDTFIDFYLQSFDYFKKKNKYPTYLFWKAGLIAILVVDLIIFIPLTNNAGRPIRPFRLLRACTHLIYLVLPAVFDSEVKKTLIALFSAYKDFIVFIIYYSVIIFGFALIGTKVLTFDPGYSQPNSIYSFDEYNSNYNDLSMMIFQTYALATYDNYPDNQILAVQNYQPNTIYFIVFIFLNMFLFASIPGSIFYDKFRQTRSKYIIIDEIKQQHSLILAFVTLAKDETNLSFDTLIKFLFFFYKYKLHYVEYITEICLKLDDNNNQTIQVNQFMELSKILIYNSAMYPPAYEDIPVWVAFRKTVNQHLGLKAIVKHWLFDTIVAVLIVVCAVNSIFHIFTDSKLAQILDTFFIWLFLVELIVRIIGIGPQKFFAKRWNGLDALMIVVSVLFFLINTEAKGANFVKMFRFFRLAGFIRIILQTAYFKSLDNSIINNIKRVFTTFLQIMPIIVKFFHLFAFIFFIFGIIGMELFYSTEEIIDTNDSYNQFDQYSNFQTFIHSQYIMMQILTEGSWTNIAWSYCYRQQNYYGYIVALFIFMHIMIVTVAGNLLKGIFWQCYFTVSGMLDEIQQKQRNQQQKQEQNQQKITEITEINEIITKNESFEPNTIIKREIIEKKLDLEILKRIKNFQFHDSEERELFPQRRQNRSKIVSRIMEDLNITPDLLDMPKKKINAKHQKRKKTLNLHNIDTVEVEEEDFQEEMEELLNRLIVSSRIKFSEIIAYPRSFVNFLNSKFKEAEEYQNGSKFDLNLNPLSNDQSMNFHMYSMNAIMGLESSTREKKNIIVNSLLTNKLIDEKTADSFIATKHCLKKFHIDSDGAVRKMYLSETNENLVKKFEIQYFSDVYGNSFKQINKITLEPLLKFQASLTYSLWNILRYEQIDMSDFFQLITHVEDQMSNKLLKQGSLVKFVYKLDHESDIWFSIELKRHQEMQIRFIKTGLWTQTAEMYESTTYYAKDVFNWNLEKSPQQKTCEQYMKLFYQSFQTLAFSLYNKKYFFQTNPRYFLYDLYIHNFDVSRKGRKSSFGQLKISNIMLVVLCKEDQRIDIGEKNLNYHVSEIKSQPRKRKEEDFILDDEHETYEKLKNLGAEDHELIVESQGLPFAYILNLIKQISDMLKIHHQKFVSQVERALNDRYNSVNSSEHNADDIIQIPEVKVTLESE